MISKTLNDLLASLPNPARGTQLDKFIPVRCIGKDYMIRVEDNGDAVVYLKKENGLYELHRYGNLYKVIVKGGRDEHKRV